MANGQKTNPTGGSLITVTRHGSSLEIGRPRKATIYGHQLVSSPSGAAINKAFRFDMGPTSYSRTPRHDHHFTRPLGGSSAIVRPTSHDIRQACHDAFPWFEETTGCWTSLDDFAQHDNEQRIPSSLAAGNFHQTE
jgi:hypothetical protein